MKTPPPTYDPPLIDRAKVPIFVRVRDVILTILAWAVLLHFIREPLHFFYDFFSFPHFSLSRFTPQDVQKIWVNLRGFAYLALFVVLCLVFWGIVRRHDLRRVKDSEEPLPISLEDLAARRNLNPERLEQLQNEKIVVIQFDDNHRATSAESKPLPPVS